MALTEGLVVKVASGPRGICVVSYLIYSDWHLSCRVGTQAASENMPRRAVKSPRATRTKACACLMSAMQNFAFAPGPADDVVGRIAPEIEFVLAVQQDVFGKREFAQGH